MKFFTLFISLIISIQSYSQFKEYKKLDELFNEKQFEKCIEQSLKYNKKEPKELVPILYCAKAYYELYKVADEKEKLNQLKQSMKYAAKISKIDKNEEAKEQYSSFMDDLHKTMLDYGSSLYYGENKDKSKPVFDYLVKIYLDTTQQYYDFHPEDRKNTTKGVGVNAVKEKVNQVDKNGLKQGLWKKVYPSGVLAYEVYFKDGKPTGIHKRYHENGKLMAQLSFDDKGEWADAKLYDDKGMLVAEGKYKDQKREGTWLFYYNGKKIVEEKYKDGLKNGISKAFFENGQVADERNWEMDVENGVWRQYYPSGKLKLETRVDKGVRNSVYYTYYENGRFEVQGHYKNDRMEGDWIYFDNGGKETKRIKYTNGIAENQEELDEEENKVLQKLEKNKDRLLDPADYINNPNEYLKKSGLR